MAALYRRFGDFDVAEEAVQGAVVEALASWRRDGTPDRPGAWLATAAQRNAMDLLRSRGRRERATQLLAETPPREPDDDVPATDDRLSLLFACCHPALAPEARLPLTLRAVIGLTTPQIARAFLVNEQALAQRIVRAKRKIVSTGIDLRVPDRPRGAAARRPRGDLRDVQRGLRLLDRADPRPRPRCRRGLAGRGGRDQPPGAGGGLGPGRAAHHPARPGRRPVQPFRASWSCSADQDRSLWDRGALEQATHYLEHAASLRSPGSYQLQAAIAACHAEARSWKETDWLQIVTLYGFLIEQDPSPVVRLNAAIALAQLGPRQAAHALAEVEGLANRLDGYHLWHATRAELLRLNDRDAEAAAADERALELTSNEAERRLIQTRLRRHPLIDGS